MSSSQVSWVDYLVLSFILLISVFIGFYHGFRDKISKLFLFKKRVDHIESFDMDKLGKAGEGEETNEAREKVESNAKTKTGDYLTANSTMGILPVAFSLLASFYSATALLGAPAEVYQYGIQYWLVSFGQASCPLIGAFVTGPFFAKLKISSVFEYFEMRFQSKKVRLVGMGCYLIRNSISCAIFMYGPATSLALLANLNEKLCIGLLGFIGTLYTTIGGLRGVIWNDLFQALIMFTSLTIIVVKGLIDVGGFSNLWMISYEGGRLNFFNFNPDPFIRQSFWSLIIGQAIYMSMSFAFDQQMMQRFQASRTKKIAIRALVLNSPGVFLIMSLCCFVGLVVYANFFDCDPLTHPDPSKRISSPNQLVGYFVVNNLHEFPGVAGIFLASIFCGSLSSVSSYLNSQAAIIWHDILLHFDYFRSFDDAKSLTTNKLLVLLCGLIGSGLAFVISYAGGNLMQISTSLNGAFNSPIMGLFLLGMLFSVSTPIGAIIGTIAGFSMALWLSLGSYLSKPMYPMLNVTTAGCPNATDFPLTPVKNETIIWASELTGLNKFYSLSYMYFMPFGILVTVIVGLIASLIDGCFQGGHKKRNYNRDFIYFDLCGCCVKGEK